MRPDLRLRNYWREEFALVAVLLILFSGVIGFGIGLPFDARLFPLIIGAAGIGLCLLIARHALQRRSARTPAEVVPDDDPAANATWSRFATAVLSAPIFGLVFWLFGFFIASLAAMFVMPPLMGYTNRRTIMVVGLATVAVLAAFFPYLAGVNLPHGVVGDWLINQLQPQ